MISLSAMDGASFKFQKVAIWRSYLSSVLLGDGR